MFEALQKDRSGVREKAHAADILPFHAEGYTDVTARAAALSAIEDLPSDMRQFTRALRAGHRESREREESRQALVRDMQTQWRRWPVLVWVDSRPPAGESPAQRNWREEAERMLGAARGWLDEDAGLAKELDRIPGATDGMEKARRDMARVHAQAAFPVF